MCVEGYRTFFHGIVGFFVCEDHILNTGTRGIPGATSGVPAWRGGGRGGEGGEDLKKIHNFCFRPLFLFSVSDLQSFKQIRMQTFSQPCLK